MTTPSKRAPTPNFEVPDLDLGLSPVPPARAPARPSATRPQSGAHQIRTRAATPDATDDFELDDAARLSLDLGADLPRSPNRARPAAATGTLALGSVGDDFELDEALVVEAVASPVDTRPWPLGRTNDTKPSTVTPEEVAYRAAYGNGSVPFFLAPAYAWRVWNRRRALAHDIEHRQNERAQREAERDRLLVDLALSLRQDLAKQDRFSGMLAELSSATQALDGRVQALATTNATLDRELGAHDTELSRFALEYGERANVVQVRQRARNVKATDHQRTSAKLKRVQIEIRNATEKGRAIVGHEGGALPTPLARHLSELTAMETTLVRELAHHQTELDEANRALEESDQQLAEIQAQSDALRSQKQLVVQNSRAKVEREASQAESARSVHLDIAKRIAFAVLDLKGAIPVDRITLDRIQGADDRVEAELVEIEKLTLALDAYDRATYSLGLKLVFAPIAFVLAVLLLRTFL